MPSHFLTDLQSSYVSSLKAITGGTNKRKTIAIEKKNDDAPQPQWRHKTENFEKEKAAAHAAFPITPKMLIFSGSWWICIILMCYYATVYGMTYSRITKEQDLKDPCVGTISTVKEDNIKILENYTLGDARSYMTRLKPSSEDFPIETKDLPPIVTAVTSSQFFQLQGLVAHIQEDIKPTQPDIQLIVYDLGLYARERELLQKYCHCEIREVDFEAYPPHVAIISTFAWRPVILASTLKEFGSVMYVEPTTRFKKASSVNFLRMRGSRSYFVWDYIKFQPFISWTDPDMFTYLGEQRCAFAESSLLTPEAIVLYRTEETWNELMKPWLKCALSAECISPINARYSGCFEIRKPRTTGCHRYDMSALTLILNRGSQYTIGTEKMVSFRLTYSDHAESFVFEEQPWRNQQIYMIVLAPFILVILIKFAKRRRGSRFC